MAPKSVSVGDPIELWHGCKGKLWIADTVASVDGENFVTACGCHRSMSAYGSEWKFPGEAIKGLRKDSNNEGET